MRKKISAAVIGLGPVAGCLPASSTGSRHQPRLHRPPRQPSEALSNGTVTNCGDIQWEPQSVEGSEGLPGRRARRRKDLLRRQQQLRPARRSTPRGGAWPTTRVSGGQNYTFRWQFTAMHATTDFKYYITKDGLEPEPRPGPRRPRTPAVPDRPLQRSAPPRPRSPTPAAAVQVRPPRDPRGLDRRMTPPTRSTPARTSPLLIHRTDHDPTTLRHPSARPRSGKPPGGAPPGPVPHSPPGSTSDRRSATLPRHGSQRHQQVGSSGAATVAELVRRRWGDHRVGAKYGDLVLTHHRPPAVPPRGPHCSPTCCPRLAPSRTSGSCSTTPRVPAVAERGGPRRGRRRRDQPHPPGPRTRPRHPAHRMPRADHRTRPPAPAAGLDLPGGSGCWSPDNRAYGPSSRRTRARRPTTRRRLPGRPARARLRCSSTSPPARPARPRPRSAPRAGWRPPEPRWPALRPAPGRRPLHLHAAVPRQRGDRRLGARAAAGAAVALRRRFSASGFLPDVRRYGATYFTYVGRAVQYLLATRPNPDDRTTRCGSASARRRARWTAALRRAVRGPARGGLRLLRGRRGDPAHAGHPARRDRAGRARQAISRWSTRRPARSAARVSAGPAGCSTATRR